GHPHGCPRRGLLVRDRAGERLRGRRRAGPDHPRPPGLVPEPRHRRRRGGRSRRGGADQPRWEYEPGGPEQRRPAVRGAAAPRARLREASAASGEWTATADLTLKTPLDVEPGSYSSTLTLSLFEEEY